MTETRDKLNAFVDSMPVTDALKGELKRMLDDLKRKHSHAESTQKGGF